MKHKLLRLSSYMGLGGFRRSHLYMMVFGLTLMVSTTFGQTSLAKWDFNASGGVSTKAAYAKDANISSTNLATSFGSGLTATNFLGNGFTATNSTAVALSDALTGNQYISFKIAPNSGSSVTIQSINIRPVSQNRARSFALFSSRNGFAAGNVIGTISANGSFGAGVSTFTISSGHSNLTTETEFRIYIYGYNNVYESVGLGESTGDDLEILGSTSSSSIAVTGVSVSPTSASVNVGSTTPLTATISPSNATNQNVTWSTSNSSIATVNTSGLVTGVVAGTAIVTVTTQDGSKTATSAITVSIPSTGSLAKWDFASSGGATTKGAYAKDANISSTNLATSFGSGLSAFNYLGNGFTATNSTALTLSDALSGNQYISFKIAPNSGSSATIQSINVRPVSQNRARSFALFSSRNGFAAGNVISTISFNGGMGAAVNTFTIGSGHTNLTTETEFRIYIYGYNNVYESVGLGESTGDDLEILGSTSGSGGGGDTQAPTVPTSLASPSKTSNSVSLSWTASTDNVGVAGYQVYTGSTLSGTTSGTTFTVSSLSANTAYSFTVKAFDAAGNVSAATSSLNVTTNVLSNATNTSLGINVSGPTSYDANPNWADAMMESRDKWYVGSANGDVDAPADANGWPTTDASVMLWEGLNKRQGTYKVYIKGQADASDQFNYATFSNKAYDAAKNLTTYTMTVTDASSQNFIFRLANTKRTPASPLNSGVFWVKVMKPTSFNATTSYDTSVVFTPYYTNALKRYSYFRFMPGTNSNQSVNWEDRTRVNENSQVKILPNEGSEGNGFAWEYKIKLCNDLQKDMWVNVPFKATPDYITNLANLIKNGSTVDGKFYPGLDPSLKLYVELSNELWNYGGADFKQSNQLLDSTSAEMAKANSPIVYDGEDNIGYLRFKEQATKTKKVSEIFRSVFGDAQMMTRVRPLMMWQYENLNGSADFQLEFLNNYYNNADGNHVSTPHPVNYYIWGAGGAVYYNSNNDQAGSVDGIYNSGIPESTYVNRVNLESAWAKAYGLKYVAYEGGMGVGGDGMTGVALAAREDPRAKTAELESYRIFKQAGGDMYTFGTYAQWSDTYTADSSPLNQGVDQINASTDPLPTYGVGISSTSPTSISGVIIDNQTYGSLNVAKFGDNTSVKGYIILVTTAGTYTIDLIMKSQTSGGVVGLYVDGILKGQYNVPVSADYVKVIAATINLTNGQHGIIVKPAVKASGSNFAASFSQIIIVPGSAGREGIEENLHDLVDEVSVFPNPAANVLNVNTATLEGGDIYITDLEGKVLASLHANTKLATISLGNFTSGIYIVTVKTANGIVHKKVSVE